MSSSPPATTAAAPAAPASNHSTFKLPGAAAWDGCAEKYSISATKVTGPHAHWIVEQVLSEAQKEGKMNLRVLDVACGSGAAAMAAVQRTDIVASVTASDFSPAMCKVVEQRYASLPADQPRASLHTLISDAGDLSALESNSFDVAFCIFGIMLLPDPVAAARELVRVVKAGGLVGFGTWMPLQSQMHGLMMNTSQFIAAKTTAAKTTTAAAAAVTEQQKPAGPAHASSTAAKSDASATSSSPPPSSGASMNAAVKMLQSLPYSQVSQFEELFLSLNLEKMMITPHAASTTIFHGGAKEWWGGVQGSSPVAMMAKATPQAEEEARQLAAEFVGQFWGKDAPFALTSTSLVAIGRKQA